MAPPFHKHIRLPGHDYTQGIYYVTLCTHARIQAFGQIVGTGANARMDLSPVGRMIDECWQAIPHHFPHVKLDETQIMPDHLHAILILAPRPGMASGPSTRRVDPTESDGPVRARPKGPRSGSLGAIIGAFKSETTLRVNRAQATMGRRLWQLGFYDRIIRRDNGERGRITQYIAENPANWQ